MNMEDLFPEFAPISTSQEEILQWNRFFVDPFPEITSTYHHHHQADLIPTIFLVDIQGVVHAPPLEETYFLSSGNVDFLNCQFNTADDFDLGFLEIDSDQVRVSERENSNLGEPPQKKIKSLGMNGEDGNVYAVNNDDDICREIPDCSFNTADDETLELMDFENNSHLGFPENLLCVEGDGLTEMDSDEVKVSERENSDLGESPQEKMKSLEMNDEDGNVVCGVVAVNNDDDGCVVSGVDAVNNDDDDCREIPRRNEQEKKLFVFDVLRVLAENTKKVEDENKNCTVLETAKSNGITFPRPWWFPKHRKSEIFNFDD